MMDAIIIFNILCFLHVCIVTCTFTGEPRIEIETLSAQNGYAIRTHEVETEDGYLLDVIRLVPRKSSISGNKRQTLPVFFMHGLLGSAENFALMGNESLSFLLGDAGYDVWLGNARGTWHSRKHKVLDPDRDEDFWNFTWHEIGVYDLPAMIDYILRVTGKRQLSYVGHSQGGTSFLVMCSERPEYNEKIKVHIALAPACFLHNNKHPGLILLGQYYKTFRRLPSLYGIYEFKAVFRLRVLYTFLKSICVNNDLTLRKICKKLVVTFAEPFGNDLMDDSLLPLITDCMPAGISLHQIGHYFQVYGTGSFAQYDWGREINLKKYRSETPSVYNLSRITAPVVIYYGMNDGLVNYKDVENLIASLPNVLESEKVADSRWAHLNFLFARNVIQLSYQRIMDSLDKYG